MTSQDPVLYRAPIQGETHMRATIVHRIDVIVFCKHCNVMLVATDYYHALILELR